MRATSLLSFVDRPSHPPLDVGRINHSRGLRWLVLLVGTTTGFCFAGATETDHSAKSADAKKDPARPNVIFILCDDLGFGDVGVFFQNLRQQKSDASEPWHLTPKLDSMALEGIQLPHHYCPAPVCAPSRASLMLGVHQGHSNIRDNQFDKELEDNHTLATVLRDAGYHTAAIGKWGLQGKPDSAKASDNANNDSTDSGDAMGSKRWPGFPTNRGFDDYFGYVRHRDGHALSQRGRQGSLVQRS